jgi:hypothetical protein
LRIADSTVEHGGKQYRLLKGSLGSVALVRDDTANRRVYIKGLTTQLGFQRFRDTSEFVFMDYNLQLGDTLRMPLAMDQLGGGDSVSVHVVYSVDSIHINNIWHKKFEMLVPQGFFEPVDYYEFTEGVGSTTGPFFILYGSYYSEPGLVCFQNQGINPLSKYDDCGEMTGIGTLRMENTLFSIYPNPAHDKITIGFVHQPMKKYTLKIMDIFGKIKMVSTIDKDKTINIQKLTPGIYVVQVSNEEGCYWVNKFVVSA